MYGVTVRVYDNGEKLEELIIPGTTIYQSKNIALPADLELDSIVATAPGREKKKLENYTVKENANRLELVPDPAKYDHWFSNSASTPGAHAGWFKGGVAVLSADVGANGFYLTGKWTTTISAETADSVVATKDGFNKLKLVNVSAAAGNNNLQLLLDQITYQYRFTGAATTPAGTIVTVYEDGADISGCTVTGTSYATNNWTSTLSSMNIDSVVFSYPGYVTQRFLNVAVVPGDNVKNAALVQKSYNHTLIINILSSEAGEGKMVRDGTITIDGISYSVVNQTLTRSWTDYNPTAGVTYDININGVGHLDAGPRTVSVGNSLTENRTLTANTFSFLDASKVASVGKLAGKNLTFVAFSDQAYTLPDDLMNIRDGSNHGIISYILPDVTFVNDTINPNTGLPISAQNKIDQQNAIDFLAAELTTRTGLTLVNAYKIKGDHSIWSNFVGECIIYKSNMTPGNGKTYVTSNTFNESDAHTRPTDGFNTIIAEGTGAQLCIYDLISGDNGNGMVVNGSGIFTGLSWIGDVAAKAAYLFPEAFFKKK